MNPVNLPHPQDAGPDYSVLRSVLFFALYAALIVGTVLYLRWKLPREEQEKTNDGDEASS